MAALSVAVEVKDAAIASAVAQIRMGKSLRAIATEKGVPFASLRRWLMTELGPDYRDAQRAGILAALNEADEGLDDAKNHLEFQRAREHLTFWKWIAERRIPEWFSPRQEISGPGGEPLALSLEEAARRLAFIRAMNGAIDVEPTPDPVAAITTIQTAAEAGELTTAKACEMVQTVIATGNRETRKRKTPKKPSKRKEKL